MYLELADLAKRENRFSEARALYRQVNTTQVSSSSIFYPRFSLFLLSLSSYSLTTLLFSIFCRLSLPISLSLSLLPPLYFSSLSSLQPYAAQGWLEHSKMEEECGELLRCQQILYTGLAYCAESDGLLIKAIKHEEKMNNLTAARALLSRLKNMSIEKSWKPLLEGGTSMHNASHGIQ